MDAALLLTLKPSLKLRKLTLKRDCSCCTVAAAADLPRRRLKLGGSLVGALAAGDDLAAVKITPFGASEFHSEITGTQRRGRALVRRRQHAGARGRSAWANGEMPERQKRKSVGRQQWRLNPAREKERVPDAAGRALWRRRKRQAKERALGATAAAERVWGERELPSA